MPDMAVRTAFTAKDGISKNFDKMGSGATKFGKVSSKAFRKSNTAAKGLGSTLKSFKGIFAGIGVAMVARQAKQAVMDFATAGDEAAKTSRRLGLTAESLQELSFAADRAGVSGQETIKSFEKLNKNVGDLKAGTGSLRTILNNTNPALAEQLKNVKSNEEAFALITKEINKMPTQMDKASLAQAAFGRSGLKMLTVMEGGIEGINKLREEARKYGGVMSNDAAKNSEAFIDSLTNMKFAFKGLGVSLLSGTMQPLTKLMQDFANFIAANREIIKSKVGEWIDGIKTGFKIILPILKTAFKLFKAIFNFLEPFAPVILGIVAAMKAYSAVQGLVNGVTSAFNLIMSLNPVVLIVGLIIGAIYLLWKNWDTVTGFMTSAWEAMSSTVLTVWNSVVSAIKTAINAVVAFFSWAWQKIKAGAVFVWQAIKAGFMIAFNFIKKIVFTFADYFLTIWGTIINGILTAASKIGGALGLDTSAIDGVISKVSALQKTVRGQSFIGDVTGESPQSPAPQAPNASEVQSRYAQNTTVNVNNAQPGTTADVTPKRNASINYRMLGANQ